MISYFYSGKGRKQLKVCEDSLTSIVFDTLKYLPSPIFWSLLKSSLYQDRLPSVSGELVGISFWDKWGAADTGNTNYVEPDVFLQFAEFDIIIEAKRWDLRQQYDKQLKNQIIAYNNEFLDIDKKLYYIKLGGLHSKENEPNYRHIDSEVVICKTDWTRLLDSISEYLGKIKSNDNLVSGSHIRILEDCIHGFALHQYYKKKWLSQLKTSGQINHKTFEKQFNYAKRPKK